MKYTRQLVIRIKALTRYWSVIKDPSFKKEFYAEISLLNFNRQRYFGYFLLLMGFFQLYADLFWGDFWDTYQVSYFMILDITVVLAGIIIVLISHINPPKTFADIRPWHAVYFYTYLSYHLFWSVAISIVEAKSANGVPTFLVGIFAAATIYLVRGFPLFILLSLSAFSLFIGLSLTGVETEQLVNQYSPTIILVLIAWIVSRVLMNTRKRSFLSRKEIEEARDNLDLTVKERTLELQQTNEQLMEEINERHKYEKSLEREKKKAEEADRLKSVFLANMSHEIRTPLNGIIGFGDLLKNPELSLDKKLRYLEIIGNNSQQLLKIIDDLMDISMIESNQLKFNIIPLRIAHILPDTEVFYTNYLRIQNKEHIKIINDGFIGSGDDMIQSDPARVTQVLYNLMGNAVKFTHEGHIRFGAKIEEGHMLVYVEDTGIGISADKCNAIFQRFRQGEESTSRAYGGTGLGLSISKGIIDLLGGMIWLDMSYKAGARFCFSLPTSAASENSRKKIENNLKFLEKNGTIIKFSDNEELMFLDYLRICMNLQIKTTSLASLDSEKVNANAHIYILDLQNIALSNYAWVIKDILSIKQSFLIVAIKSDPELRKSLNEMGCHIVLESPVNINLLLSKLSPARLNKVMV